jgi:hypothetical protein
MKGCESQGSQRDRGDDLIDINGLRRHPKFILPWQILAIVHALGSGRCHPMGLRKFATGKFDQRAGERGGEAPQKIVVLDSLNIESSQIATAEVGISLKGDGFVGDSCEAGGYDVEDRFCAVQMHRQRHLVVSGSVLCTVPPSFRIESIKIASLNLV